MYTKGDKKLKNKIENQSDVSDTRSNSGANLWTKVEMDETESETKKHDLFQRAKLQMEYLKRLFQRENFYLEIVWFLLLFCGIIICFNSLITFFSA